MNIGNPAKNAGFFLFNSLTERQNEYNEHIQQFFLLLLVLLYEIIRWDSLLYLWIVEKQESHLQKVGFFDLKRNNKQKIRK